MDKKSFIDSDPAVLRAKAKIDALQSKVSSRWGEHRRFAGRSAGLRLDNLAKARAQWSKAYDRAEARFDKLKLVNVIGLNLKGSIDDQ